MNSDGVLRILMALARGAVRSADAQLCRVCTDLVGVAGAGITLVGGAHSGPISVSRGFATLEDAQYRTGAGPCQDALRLGTPVHATRLDDIAAQRWPLFVDVARRNGIAAAFAYPLASGTAQVGVLTLYELTEGELSVTQHEDCLSFAEVVSETVLSLRAAAAPGQAGEGLEVAYRAEIHQASGIIAVQLQVHPDEALIRLRRHAFATDEPLAAIATQVINGQLRLPDDRAETNRYE